MDKAIDLRINISGYNENGLFKEGRNFTGKFNNVQEAKDSSAPLWQELSADLPKQIFIFDAITGKTLTYSDNFEKLVKLAMAKSTN